MSEPKRKPLVLVLCTANSARSQMAEAWLRAKAGNRFEVASAGLSPSQVNPMTHRVMAEVGIDTSGHRSKGTKEFLGRARVDYAIVVCEQAQQSCPRIFPFASHMLYWPFPDPAAAEGGEIERLECFREVRDRIGARIDQWLDDLPSGRI